MAYKKINVLLLELNYLSKPGLEEAVKGMFNEIENVLGNLNKVVLVDHLNHIIVGYQHGYSEKSVAEYIAHRTIDWAVVKLSGLDNYEATREVIYRHLLPGALSTSFFDKCDYIPASDEIDLDPLSVIEAINKRRNKRQEKVNLGNTQSKDTVTYPSFGGWVDQSVRVTNGEIEEIKDFRTDVHKELLAIRDAWFE